MTDTYDEHIATSSDALGQHFVANPELEVSMLLSARRDALQAEQTALLDMGRRGLASTEVIHEMTVEIDNRFAALDLLEERWETDTVFPDAPSDAGEDER